MLKRLLSNKHTTGAGIIYFAAASFGHIAQVWWPTHAEQIASTVQYVKESCVTWACLMAGDARKGFPETNGGSAQPAIEPKRTKTILAMFASAALIALPAKSQTLPVTPPTQGDVLTNLLAATPASAVATFALNLLPGWNKSATNSFGANELELEVSPTWKSATASGSTPFVSIGLNYYVTRNWGGGLDVLTFGNGSGSSTLDSAHVFGLFRKDLGNVAGYVMAGGGRDISLNRFVGEIGGGLEYRYTTGIGILVDTRYCYLFGGTRGDHEFLTRVGLTLHF